MVSFLVSLATLLALQSSPYSLLSGGDGQAFPPAGWELMSVVAGEGETRLSYADDQGFEVTLFVTDREPGASAFALSAHWALNYKVEEAPDGVDPDSFPPRVAVLVGAAAEALVAGDRDGQADDVPQPGRGGGQGGGADWAPEQLLRGTAGQVPELVPGFRFRALSIEGARIRFRFEHPYGGRLDLWVAPRTAGHKGYADTDYLTIWYDLDESYPEGAEARGRLDSFLEETAASVRQADSGQWAALAPQDSGPGTGDETGRCAQGVEGQEPCPPAQAAGDDGAAPATPGGGDGPAAGTGGGLSGRPLERVAAATAFLALVLSLVSLWLVAGSLRRTLTSAGRTERLLVLAAVAGGAVRLIFVPLVPVKVGMVFPMLEQALRLEGLPRYGAGGAVLAHLVLRFLSAHVDELLRVHSLLAMATPLLGAAVARRLFPERGVAFFAAFYLALTPLFLRDGNTESLLVPGFFLFLVGLHLALDFVEQGRLSCGLAALPALVAGASMRPEITVLALALPFLLAWRAGYRLRFAAVGAALLLLLVPGILFLVVSTGREVAGDNLTLERLHPGFVLRNLVTLDVLVAPRFFPLSVSLLGLAGAWLGVRERRYRRTAVILVTLVAGWLALLAMDLNEESLLRLEVPAAMTWSVLAALASARLAGLARTAGNRGAVSLALLAAFVASSIPGVGPLFARTNSQEDSRVFHAAVERLPPGKVRLVVLTAEDLPELAIADPGRVGEMPPAGHVPVHRQLPLYRLRAMRPDVEVVSVSRLRTGLPRDSRTFFYLGASCYAYRDAGGQDLWGVPVDALPALHPACRQVLMTHRVSRLYLERVDNRPELAPAFHWYPESLGGMTLGLLELSAASPSGRPMDPWATVAEACNREARPLLLAGAVDRAVDVLDRCERLLPESITLEDYLSSALYLRGTREDRREDLDGAFCRLMRVAESDPGLPQILSRLGSVYFFYSKFRTDSEMEREIDSRLEADPNDIVGLYLKGLFLFYAHRDYAASAGYFLKVLEQKEDEPRVFVYLALDSFYRGRQDEAEAYIARGVALAPEIEDPDVYYVRSIIVREKNLEQAASDIERYLELTDGPDKVRHPTKQKWLRTELENLRAGRPSAWWRSREPSEPWNE